MPRKKKDKSADQAPQQSASSEVATTPRGDSLQHAVAPAPEAPNAVSSDLADFLSANSFVDAINASLPADERLKPIPQEYKFKRRDAETVSIAYHAAFELIGGVPRLVQWAQKNPDKFFEQYSRVAKSNDSHVAGGTTIVFNTPVPHSPLDNVAINEKGQVIDLEGDEDLPE